MEARKRWSDLSSPQQAAIVFGAVVQFSLLAAALIDISRRSEDRVRGPKAMWTALAFVNYIGPLSYFIWGRRRD